MPKTNVIFYQEADGSVPIIDWMDNIPTKAKVKCRVKLSRLAEMGHELRRPEADLLRDKIYELRVSLQGVHYRLLYFFHGNAAAIVAHGIVKESAVPPKEIERAIERKKQFESNPTKYTYLPEQL